jgi:hypothetical protein
MKFKEFLAEEKQQEQEFKTRVFRVPVDHLDLLEAKIKKANKLAAKLGTKPAVINYIERKFEKIKLNSPDRNDQNVFDALRGEKFREYQYLTVTGEVPILAGGWSFAGKIEPHEAGNILKSAPGHKIPARFNNTDPCHCEHCNKSRQRKETFIVKKGRKYTQVGRQCLKDFMGHDHPEKFAAQAEWIYDIEKELRDYENDNWGSGRYVPHFGTEDILAAAHSAIVRDGFIPKSAERGMPTSATVYRHFIPPTGHEAKYHVPLVITKKNQDDAKATIAWVKERAKTDKSEFFQNLAKFVAVEANSAKYTGYLAAAAMMYQKEQEQLAAKKKMSDGIKSEPIGKEGDKVKLEAEVIGAFKYQRNTYHYYDSGVSQILTMKDTQGRLIKMFTSNLDVKKGDMVTLSGKLGKAEEEKYETSPFKGKIVTMMAPRTRIEVKPKELDMSDPERFANIKAIQGKPIPADVTKIEIVYSLSDQWNTTLHIETKQLSKGFERKFKNTDIEWNK